MAGDQETYLAEFYRAFIEQPLEPDSPRYVHLYEDGELSPADPMAGLATTIEWNPLESKQLFSGFRGTGKSTELRRLRRRLTGAGNTKVVLCDMQDYLNLTTPVDISDFLVTLAGAFSDALQSDPELLGANMLHEGYWTRFWGFLKRTRVDLPSMDESVKDGGVGTGIKLNLKADPSFRHKVQQQLQGHLGSLSSDVNAFMEECFKALQKRHGDDVRVVLLVDSVERIRGTSTNAGEVADSVETLFEGHADKLGFPYLHVVYSVPPWLKIKSPGVAGLYDSSQQIPCVKVRDMDGSPCRAGLDVLEKLVRRRGDWERLLGNWEALEDLCLASGGYLRDLFRLMQSLLRLCRGRALPASEDVIELVKHEIRNSYLPIANEDALWLDRIATSHGAELEDGERLHELSRYFDTHLVLSYRNGDEWWSVHPLVAEQVRQQAETTKRRRIDQISEP